MEGKKGTVEKPRRSNSQKLLGMLENTLKIPQKINRSSSHSESHSDSGDKDLSEDTPTPTKLPIMRSYSTKAKIKKACDEYDSKFNDNIISSEGKLRYEAMLQLLTCCHCERLAAVPMAQCRKGHVYCKACKVDNKIVTCKVCKQTFVDAPNVAFEKLVTFIALPCKYGSRGCSEYVFLHSRLDHETFCHFRPVSCQNSVHGCTSEFSYKDICWHHKICSYANYPHANVLPNMPSRKKSSQPLTTICRPTTPTTPATPASPPATPSTPPATPSSLEPPPQPVPAFPLPSQPPQHVEKEEAKPPQHVDKEERQPPQHMKKEEAPPQDPAGPPVQPARKNSGGPVHPTRKKAVKSHPVEVSAIVDSSHPTSPSITINPPTVVTFAFGVKEGGAENAPGGCVEEGGAQNGPAAGGEEAGAENGIDEALPALETLEIGSVNGDGDITVLKPTDHVVLPSTGLLNDGIYGFPTAV